MRKKRTGWSEQALQKRIWSTLGVLMEPYTVSYTTSLKEETDRIRADWEVEMDGTRDLYSNKTRLEFHRLPRDLDQPSLLTMEWEDIFHINRDAMADTITDQLIGIFRTEEINKLQAEQREMGGQR